MSGRRAEDGGAAAATGPWPEARDEIGGEFPLDLDLRDEGTATAGASADLERAPPLPALPGGGPPVLVRSGREALRAILRALAARGVRELALPAWLCESLLQAARGLVRVQLLPVGEKAAPTPAAVDAFAAEGAGAPGERAILAVPGFGWPLPGPVQDAMARAASRGLVIVEDRSHVLLSPAAAPLAPIGFASLRKWAGIPDGAALWGLRDLDFDGVDDGFVEARATGMRRKALWLHGGARKEDFLPTLRSAEAILDRCEGVRPISESGRTTLRGLDWDAAARRRQENWDRLDAGLRRLPWLRPLHAERPPGVTPLAYVLRTARRDRLREALHRERVWCPVHWPLPDAVDPGLFPESAALRDEILSVPCDQRYGAVAMERILRIVEESAA
jgi:hypothetical protein